MRGLIMAHSESDIRKAARILLEKYGCLNTSEIIEHMGEVITFDEEDLTQSETRNEPKVYQIIRNPALRDKYIYEEGIWIDKSVQPAMWYPMIGTGERSRPISSRTARSRRNNVNDENPRRHYRKVDWDGVNERRTAIGKAGENFVYSEEIAKVSSFAPDAITRVIHLSEKQGDGFGYDILSLDEEGKPLFIEVKTTKDGADSPFYMSINELNFFKRHKNKNAYVYRVYHFNEDDSRGDILKISAKELLDNYRFDPISFMVTRIRD